jgi:AmmeMemoRadiSam system protein B
MILPRLRTNLDLMPSPIAGQPGLLIRDPFHYSDATLIVPPLLARGLALFDGEHTDTDLTAELKRLAAGAEIGFAAGQLVEGMSQARFLEDEVYARLRESRHKAFAASPVRVAAHARSAYPDEVDPLRRLMREYLGEGAQGKSAVLGIAAPHVSPSGGWQCYRAAYEQLTPELAERTFVILGTSHYGQPDRFGLTGKSFETPLGRTRVDDRLVNELAGQRAAVMEDYCHAVEHSIEFQVLFLQSVYGPDVRILPILCGTFGRSILAGGAPEDNEHVRRFLGGLGEIAAREKDRLFWVLGIDMAHMGARYGDGFQARANEGDMAVVRERDHLRIERVIAADAHGFWDLIKENKDDLKWCGSSPLYTFLSAVPEARGRLHRYEQWNIDAQSVVSFAGMSFTTCSGATAGGAAAR